MVDYMVGVSVSVPQKVPSFWAPSLGILVLLWRWGTHLVWIMVLYGYFLPSHLPEHLHIFPPFCPSLPPSQSVPPSFPFPTVFLSPILVHLSTQLLVNSTDWVLALLHLTVMDLGLKSPFYKVDRIMDQWTLLIFVKFKIITSL